MTEIRVKCDKCNGRGWATQSIYAYRHRFGVSVKETYIKSERVVKDVAHYPDEFSVCVPCDACGSEGSYMAERA